jgi:hypothetical protein
MHISKFAWSDYFGGNLSPTYSQSQYSSQQTPSASSVYVLNCFFKECTSSSDGGALSCTSVTYLLVESSTFFQCRTSNPNGGAVYFYNYNNGQCVLHGVCCNDCRSTCTGTSRGQFAYIRVKYDLSSLNYVNYSSMVRCINERTESYFILYLSQGKICCPSINMSMTKCDQHSVIHSLPYANLNIYTCSLLYSTFADNIAMDHVCISLEVNTGYEIKCCNIIRNTESSSGTDGIILNRGRLVIEDSCILENKATYIFYSTSSNTITLSNCTVDKTTRYGTLIIQNTVTKSFILGLHHMITQYCNAEYDSAGYITAIPYVSTKKERCYTIKINHYGARISDFFSLTWVLIVAFIHPNPY